jgi:hypothetical protein
MPLLMSLEGPALTRTDQIRAQLLGASKPWWKLRSRFLGATVPQPLPPIAEPGILDVFMAHPVVLVLGIFGGLWLAGSKTGQGFFKKK